MGSPSSDDDLEIISDGTVVRMALCKILCKFLVDDNPIHDDTFIDDNLLLTTLPFPTTQITPMSYTPLPKGS